MKRWPLQQDVASGISFVVIGIVVWMLIADLAVGSARAMGPGYFPRLICAGLVGLGILLIARGWLGASQSSVQRFHLRPLVVITASILFFSLGLRVFGLILSVILLVGISALSASEIRWREQAVIAVLLALFAVAVFVYGLGMPVPVLPR